VDPPHLSTPSLSTLPQHPPSAPVFSTLAQHPCASPYPSSLLPTILQHPSPFSHCATPFPSTLAGTLSYHPSFSPIPSNLSQRTWSSMLGKMHLRRAEACPSVIHSLTPSPRTPHSSGLLENSIISISRTHSSVSRIFLFSHRSNQSREVHQLQLSKSLSASAPGPPLRHHLQPLQPQPSPDGAGFLHAPHRHLPRSSSL
jgi:hypothetical protein